MSRGKAIYPAIIKRCALEGAHTNKDMNVGDTTQLSLTIELRIKCHFYLSQLCCQLSTVSPQMWKPCRENFTFSWLTSVFNTEWREHSFLSGEIHSAADK